MTTEQYRKLGLLGCIKKIVADEGSHSIAVFIFQIALTVLKGVKALFSGVGAALVLVVNPSIQYMVFQKLKDAVARSRKNTRFSPLDIFVLASIAKVVATLITYVRCH